MGSFNLARFREAQAGVFETARAELRAGRKRSHWMWFIFPQFRGLGASAMSLTFGIGSRAEAQAYLADGVLGPRLNEVFEILLRCEGLTARQIFGTPDDLKLRSCATLFAAVSGGAAPFATALARFFEGEVDARTLALLSGAA